jgi:hypothetical protein
MPVVKVFMMRRLYLYQESSNPATRNTVLIR